MDSDSSSSLTADHPNMHNNANQSTKADDNDADDASSRQPLARNLAQPQVQVQQRITAVDRKRLLRLKRKQNDSSNSNSTKKGSLGLFGAVMKHASTSPTSSKPTTTDERGLWNDKNLLANEANDRTMFDKSNRNDGSSQLVLEASESSSSVTYQHQIPRMRGFSLKSAINGENKNDTVSWINSESALGDTCSVTATAFGGVSGESNSNSGFAILRVLDNMTTFATDTLRANETIQQPHSANDIQDASNSSALDDWRQTSISFLPSDDLKSTNKEDIYILSRPQIGVKDWSLKRSLKFECHPGYCLTQSPVQQIGGYRSVSTQSLPLERQCAVEQVAKHLISSGSNSFLQKSLLQSLNSDQERAAAIWVAGTYYWQHPLQHPLPSEVLINGFKNDDSKLGKRFLNNRGLLSSAGGAISSIGNAIRKSLFYQRVRAHGHGSLGGLGSSAENKVSINTLLSSRRREWADAFRSIYLTWIGRISQLKSFIPDTETVHNNDIGILPSFYAVSPGRIVLFRCSQKNELHNIDSVSDENCYNFLPVIHISSSSEEFRNLLRSVGIKIILTGGKEFDEPSKDDNLKYVQEIEAMGVERDVKRRSKRKNQYPTIDEGTITISGLLDCQAFFEIFHGSYGSLYLGKKGERFDVPLLITRSLGPATNFTLKQLVISERCESDKSDKKSQDSYAYLEFRGPILPCAVHDLVGSLASVLTLDKAKNAPSNSHKQALESEVGSHYFVTHLKTHAGETIESVDGGNVIGDASSGWFNGQLKRNIVKNECRHGQIISTLLWDINRKSILDYKSEAAAGAIHPTSLKS